jgi:CDP-diacylglycerol--serine O-phosphatidyltransferase
VAAAAVRLARYNVEAISPADGSVGKKGKDYFVGLPSPAAAGLAVSTVLLYYFLIGKDDGLGLKKRWAEWVTLGLPVLMLGLGWLMISRVRYMHVGNRIFSGRKRLVPVMLVLVAVVLLVGFPQLVGMLFFGTYVLGFLFWDLGRRARSARARRRRRGSGAQAGKSDPVPEAPADGTEETDVSAGAGEGGA